MFNENERVAILLDGANVYSTAKALGFDLDYRKMRDLFAKKSRLIRSFYYTAISDDAEFSPLRPLVDWLEYNGWKIITKPLKEFTDSTGRLRRKGDMTVEMTVDALEISEHVDRIVLFSGDGSLWRLVDGLQHRGKLVTVVSTIKSQTPMCSDELRRIADLFVDLDDLKPQLARPPKDRLT